MFKDNLSIAGFSYPSHLFILLCLQKAAFPARPSRQYRHGKGSYLRVCYFDIELNVSLYWSYRATSLGHISVPFSLFLDVYMYVCMYVFFLCIVCFCMVFQSSPTCFNGCERKVFHFS